MRDSWNICDILCTARIAQIQASQEVMNSTVVVSVKIGANDGANDGGELGRARPHSSPLSFAPIVRPSIIKQAEGALEAHPHVLAAGHAGEGTEVHEVGAHTVTELGIPVEVFY